MTASRSAPKSAPFEPVLSTPLPVPERLVALGFRHWMAGCQSGDVHRWEDAWAVFADELGVRNARLALSALGPWVCAVSRSSVRTVCVLEGRCPSFCRDACLAVDMVAACQHDACPALRACAFALIEARRIDEVAHRTETFATVMRSLDQTLSPVSLASIAPLAHLH
jgi:hypothetical protein